MHVERSCIFAKRFLGCVVQRKDEIWRLSTTSLANRPRRCISTSFTYEPDHFILTLITLIAVRKAKVESGEPLVEMSDRDITFSTSSSAFECVST